MTGFVLPLWLTLAQGAAPATPPAIVPGEMVHTWAFLLMLLITGGFALVTILIAQTFGPKKYVQAKYDPYECGMVPDEPVLQRMHVQFYRTGIMFLIFGVELIFLYPWAVWASRAGIPGLLILAPFMIMLIVGFAFEWTKGALEWRQK